MNNKKSELLRALKFTLFSISAGVIQIGSFSLLNYVFSMDEWLSHLIALVLSVLWNFTFNRKFTFASSVNVPKAMLLVALFYLVFTPATTYLTDMLNGGWVDWNDMLVEGLMMALNLVTEYFYQRFVVFRNSIDTAKASK